MKKIVYSLIMIIMLISCATKKQITSSTTTADIIKDSASQEKNISEDLQIEWFLDGEEASGIADSKMAETHPPSNRQTTQKR